MKNYISLIIITIFMFSCKNVIAQEAIVNTPTQKGTIGSIDIPSPDFFWMLCPWKKGTLATMTGKDGKARFAEISFIGKSGMKIATLFNFPEEPIDRKFVTAPESNILITGVNKTYFIADTANKKTKNICLWLLGVLMQ